MLPVAAVPTLPSAAPLAAAAPIPSAGNPAASVDATAFRETLASGLGPDGATVSPGSPTVPTPGAPAATATTTMDPALTIAATIATMGSATTAASPMVAQAPDPHAPAPASPGGAAGDGPAPLDTIVASPAAIPGPDSAPASAPTATPSPASLRSVARKPQSSPPAAAPEIPAPDTSPTSAATPQGAVSQPAQPLHRSTVPAARDGVAQDDPSSGEEAVAAASPALFPSTTPAIPPANDPINRAASTAKTTHGDPISRSNQRPAPTASASVDAPGSDGDDGTGETAWPSPDTPSHRDGLALARAGSPAVASERPSAAPPVGAAPPAPLASAPSLPSSLVGASDPTALPPRHASEPIVARAATIGRDVGVAIARRALGDGGTTLTIRLDPVELGRVEVRMQIDPAGKLLATISADQPGALDLLRRDSGMLAQTLAQSGLDTDAGSLRFDTRPGLDGSAGNGGGNTGGGNAGRGWGSPPGSWRAGQTGDDPAPGIPAPRATLRATGRIDLVA